MIEDLSFKNRMQIYGHALSRSESKVADFVMNNTDYAASASITALSAASGVSNATVTRFCQKLQYRNFGEFQSFLIPKAQHNDAPDEIIQKISLFYQSVIASSIELVDESALVLFADRISAADRILTFGLGSSGLSAAEISMRLSRMGMCASAVGDTHQMLAQASLLRSSDLVIAISNSGKTAEVIKACKQAKAQGTTVCFLTQYNHEDLHEIADIILFSSSVNQIEDYHYINSQLPLMLLIDAATYLLLEDKGYRSNYQKTLRTLFPGPRGRKK